MIAPKLIWLAQMLSLEKQLKDLQTKSVKKEEQEDSQPMMGAGFGSRLMLTQGSGMPMGNGMNGGMMMPPQPTGFY
jgi:hypothetical protein